MFRADEGCAPGPEPNRNLTDRWDACFTMYRAVRCYRSQARGHGPTRTGLDRTRRAPRRRAGRRHGRRNGRNGFRVPGGLVQARNSWPGRNGTPSGHARSVRRTALAAQVVQPIRPPRD